MPRVELVRVAASPEFMLNGVAVSPRRRVFASFRRWTSLAAPSVRHRQVRLARALAAERTALKPSSAFNRALALRAEANLGVAA